MEIKVEGLEQILSRMQKFPQEANSVMRKAMERSMINIQESVPPYPPPRYYKSVTKKSSLYNRGARKSFKPGQYLAASYRRTGTLGRSLNVGGESNIRRISGGGQYISGEFGTSVKYAPYVIGENQAWMHEGRWWRLPVEVVKKALPKIEKTWQQAADAMVRFLDSKGA